MSEKQKITPTESQLNAINLSGADLIISAGAGSGKTATLTKRIIKKIAEDGEDISKKLIVTFTKDASHELRQRICSAISELLKNDPSNRHLSSQMVRLGGADICTIDAFCLKIVRSSFERLDLDGGFRVADESESEVLCREAVSEVLDRFYEERGDDVNFLRVCDCFSSFSSEEGLKDELLSLYKRLITTKNGLKTLVLCPEYDKDFMKTPYGEVLRTELLSFLDFYIGFFDYALDKIEKSESAEGAFGPAFRSDRAFAVSLKELAKVGSYEEISSVIESYSPARLGSTTKVVEVDSELFKSVRSDFKDKLRKDLFLGFFSSTDKILSSSFEKNKAVCLALYDILSELDKEYSIKKRASGLCDFNDISRYAMALLYDENGNKTALAGELALSYDEIYVDEYQDTNYVQDMIFSAISRGNRFLVGDIKQSIYRFRSAEPEIFSSYLTSFAPFEGGCVDKNGNSVHMSENFRCDKGVIDFSNAVSDYMFKHSRSIPYTDKDRLKFAKIGCDYTPAVPEICIIDKTKSDEDDEEELLLREAQFVAKRVRDLIDNGYLPNGKKIEPSDIAILLRGFKKPVELYVSALSSVGVRSQYKSEARFFENSEILLAICILNAIDNPLRDVYLAGAMRSEAFGFSLEDMIRIKRLSPDASSFYEAVKRYNADGELLEKTSAFLEKLAKYRDMCRKKPTHEIVSLVLSDTGLLSMASESERVNLLRLYDLAREREHSKSHGLYSFLRFIEELKESSVASQSEDDDGCVRLMSIHASKGLEFEVCFICGCGSILNMGDTKAPIMYHRDLGVSAYVSRDNGIAKFNTLLRKCSALAIKRSGVAEEMRMLYVAMTRARSMLIMTAGAQNPEELISKCDKMRHFASEYSVLHPKGYIDWLLSSALSSPDCAKITVVHPEDSCANSENRDTGCDFSTSYGNIDEIKSALKERLEFKYPYEHLGKIPSKLTVSRLYPSILDDEDNAEISIKYTLDDVPAFARDKSHSATGAERGTATHVFMQFCDFALLDKNGAVSELERLRAEGFISPEMSELVNIGHIEAFRKSALFAELLGAKRIWREFRFNVMLPASELSSDIALENEQVLTQGVCDCIYENAQGELILVDYKTDFVTEDNFEQVLKERHQLQLGYYKKACELMFERPLSKTLIYSVPLSKAVDVGRPTGQ